MTEKTLTNDEIIVVIIKGLLIVLIMLIGAVFGAQFSDDNWKKDILKVSYAENKTVLAFNQDGITYYFYVKHLTMENYYQYLNLNIVNKSPQKQIIVGDVVYTTNEFWMWKGETTSFTAYVIDVNNTNGDLTLKIQGGSWTGQSGNHFILNEYWVEKSGHVNESVYTGWHWNDE